ncbi:MAG: Uma2 family endonuclease [Candidatus Magnetomorum sp.]|nr:Uma2 family endonuclease [Candidatus Magnetomorum sp.]
MRTYVPLIAKNRTYSSYVTPRQTNAKNSQSNNANQPSKDGLFVDESTYWDVYYEDDDFNYEWNNGILEEKEMPTFFSELCSKWFREIIDQYLKAFPIARLITFDIGFTINLSNKKAIRKPDHTLILKSNPIQPDILDCSYKGIYDVCIEFLSETQKKYVLRDTVDKKREYRGAKVKEYYIIDANKKHTVFYRLNQKGNYIKIKPDNGIIRSTILPGFQFRVEDLYQQPDMKELIKDDIYKSYILLDYQNQCKQTEQERKAKEKERKAKEKERKAKEKERKAKEKERKAKEKEQKHKEDALKKLHQMEIIKEKERKEKEAALEEVARLKKLLK